MAELQTFTLPAGSVCHRNGIPFKLQHATQIECHPANWPLIQGEPPECEGECIAHNPRTPSLDGSRKALAESGATRQQVDSMYAALQSAEVMSISPTADALAVCAGFRCLSASTSAETNPEPSLAKVCFPNMPVPAACTDPAFCSAPLGRGESL